MGEWASYSLSDLLLFSPFSYFRLYELSNAALWPWQLPLLLLATVCVYLVRRTKLQPAWLLLATLWAFVAWWFFHRHYAQIFPSAESFAVLFAVEALLLLLAALFGERWFGESRRGTLALTGWVLLLHALLFHPWIPLLMGHPGSETELFGIAPEPTALGTLGLLLTRRGRVTGVLAVIPLLWLLISGLTHLAMENPYGLIAPLLVCVAISIAAFRRRLPTQT